MNGKFRAFLALSVFGAAPTFAVTMNFDGSFRANASMYGRLDAGVNGVPKRKSYMEGRALLNPSVLVDDHFSIKSQWSLLTSPEFTAAPENSAGSGMVVGNGGFILGDPNMSNLALSRAWLEWTSDVGVFRLGRMPVDWGYGLILDDGSRDPWDDFQSTLDRIEYKLYLGYLSAGLSYSKPRKASTLSGFDDSVFYGAALQYDNPESDLNAGVLYENQWRSSSQATPLRNNGGVGATTNPNPFLMPPGSTPQFELAKATPYPLSNHMIDLYVKKTSGPFQVGGEFAYLTGKALDFGGDGASDDMSAFAGMLRVSYEQHQIKAYIEGLYASGDNNTNDNNLSGFMLLHRNRRPGLILGRELLGPYAGNTVGQGSCVAYGTATSFSGCFYGKMGGSYDWSAALTTGFDVIYARKVAAAGSSANLGIEVDFGANYLVYQNFMLGANAGLLLAGQGIGPSNPKTPFAVRATALLTF